MKNKKPHVSTNLVHKVFRTQSIARQPLSYLEKIVYKEDFPTASAKQKSKHRTWFTLAIEAFNGSL